MSIVVAAITLMAPTSAHAALTLTTDPAYNVATSPGALLGSSDQNGVLYTMSGTVIRRYDRFGKKLADITLPAGVTKPKDIAPSPTGKFIYITQGTNPVRRLQLQADGTYKADIGWSLKPFMFWGQTWDPFGDSIATDGRGYIFLSNGSFWTSNTVPTQTSVVKFAADGTPVTAFGDYGKEPGNWITNQDIAVSRDGQRVYVGENCGKSCIWGSPTYDASRVTRYDYVPGGGYKFTRIISAQGPMDGSPFPTCASSGATHSAYSLSMDVAENLYATSTSCGRLQMFDTDPDPTKDRFVKSIATYVDPSTNPMGVSKNHYLTVDWAGRIYANQWNRMFTPKTLPTLPTLPLPTLPPLPAPDTQVPIISDVVVPATTTTQTIPVTVTATDNVAVAEMQFDNEQGNGTYPWQPFASPVNMKLSDGYGAKGVYVRVRDMAGNTSEWTYRTLSYSATQPPPADTAAPILASATAPTSSSTQTVPITVDATDDRGVTQMRFSDGGGVWKPWQNFAVTTQYLLTTGYGIKTVTVQVRDAAGNVSGTKSVTIDYRQDAPPPQPPTTPDTIMPILTSATIPASTTNQTVQVSITATDNVGVAQVRFANEDGVWGAWQAYQPTMGWKLSPNYGSKAVYTQVRDAAGNESIALLSRTNYVQTTGPVDAADPVLTTLTLPATTASSTVTVTLAATDDVGVTQMRLCNEDGNLPITWQPYSATTTFTLKAGIGIHGVYAQVRDAAGRESNIMYTTTKVTG